MKKRFIGILILLTIFILNYNFIENSQEITNIQPAQFSILKNLLKTSSVPTAQDRDTINIVPLDGPFLKINSISPLNDTYSENTGETTFTCQIDTNQNITEATIKIIKYYGGWHVNKEYSTETKNFEEKSGKFEIQFILDLTNGFYTYECIAKTDAGETISTEPLRYKTGKGIVYIHQSVHTEPRLLDFSSYEQNFSGYSLIDFIEGGKIDDEMTPEYRYLINDSFGNPHTFTWVLRMDQSICQSEEGCGVTLDAFLDKEWNESRNYTYWGDGVGWHLHNTEWFDWNQYIKDISCPTNGCLPAEYWNQIFIMDDTILNSNHGSIIENTENLLGLYIMKSGRYPITSVMGWMGMSTQISNWLSKYVPFNYDNRFDLPTKIPTTEPISNIWNWSFAPHEMYSPSKINYQFPGDNTNIIMPCNSGGLSTTDGKEYLYNSFNLANQGTDIIVCHYSHSYGGISSDAVRLHYQIEPRFKECDTSYNGICLEETFPEVKYVYVNDIQMVQEVLEITDKTAPEINAEILIGSIIITSNEELWNFPIVSLQTAENKYSLCNLQKIDTNKWNCDTSEVKDLTQIRITGIDTSYNEYTSPIIKIDLIEEANFKKQVTEETSQINPNAISEIENKNSIEETDDKKEGNNLLSSIKEFFLKYLNKN